MKMIMKYLPAVALMALLGTGCKQEEVYTYKDTKDNIYFDYEKAEERDKLLNLYYSFYDTPEATEYVMEIPVRISGPRSDKERYFTVAPQSAPADMPSGTVYAQSPGDYELETTGVVPAGEGQGFVKLTLKNNDSPLTFVLKLDLLESDDFAVGFSGGAKPMNTVEVKFSRELVMPFWWNPNVFGGYAGDLKTWSRTANELFRIATGVTELMLTSHPDMDPQIQNQQRDVIRNFQDMMKNPRQWVGFNSAYQVVSVGDDPATGFATYEFSKKPVPEPEPGTEPEPELVDPANVYKFWENTELSEDGLVVWFDENGLPSIFY